MTRDQYKITHSLYESAPEMLLDEIAEINGILAKQKAKTGETGSYRFWLGVVDVMKFSWDYFQDIRWLIKKIQLLEIENRWLKDWNYKLSKRIEVFEMIKELKINGQFEDAVRRVDEIIAKGDQQFKPVNNQPDE